jgi:hypothetical protein
MPVRDLLLPELELEASFTRKHLERVPMNTLGVKPHSMSEAAWLRWGYPTWTTIFASSLRSLVRMRPLDARHRGNNVAP